MAIYIKRKIERKRDVDMDTYRITRIYVGIVCGRAGVINRSSIDHDNVTSRA